MANVLVEKQSLIDLADVLREKTGTSDPIKPEDFAAVAETISGDTPTPGPEPTPEDPVTNWGAVLYYKEMTIGFEPEYTQDCDVVSIDADKLDAWATENHAYMDGMMEGGKRLDIYWQNGCWNYQDNTDWSSKTISDADLQSEAGLVVNVTNQSFASLDLSVTEVPIPEGGVEWAELANEAQYQALNAPRETITAGAQTISIGAISRFAWGTQATYIPECFLWYTGLETVAPLPENIVTVGGYSFAYCKKFNCPLDFSHVTSMGQYVGTNMDSFNSNLTFGTAIGGMSFGSCHSFDSDIIFNGTKNIPDSCFVNNVAMTRMPNLAGIETIGSEFMCDWDKFNAPVIIPSSVKSIGSKFLCDCAIFNQPITIPATLESLGSGFLYASSRYTNNVTLEAPFSIKSSQYEQYQPTFGTYSSDGGSPIYTTGVTLVGTYASEWKSGLPDITSGSYRRKTLLG